jgi:hypothetical protein
MNVSKMAKSAIFLDRPINTEIKKAQFYKEITQRSKKKHLRVLKNYL